MINYIEILEDIKEEERQALYGGGMIERKISYQMMMENYYRKCELGRELALANDNKQFFDILPGELDSLIYD